MLLVPETAPGKLAGQPTAVRGADSTAATGARQTRRAPTRTSTPPQNGVLHLGSKRARPDRQDGN